MARPASADAGLLRGTLDVQPPRPAARARRVAPLHVAVVLAATAAVASLAITLIRLPELLAAVYRFSDAPAVSYIAQGLATGHGPQLLPTQTSIAVVWFYEVLQWVPLGIRMGVEYWTGPILSLLAGVLAVRSAYLVGGRRAALWLTLLLAVLPPVVLWPLLFSDNHVTTYLGAALLGWHLVHDLRGAPRLRRSILVGAASGVFVVSDPALVVFAVGPWLVVIFTARRRLTHDQVRSALVTASAAIGAVALALVVMAAQGIRVVGIVPAGTGTGGVGDSIVTALKAAGWIVSGGWYGDAWPYAPLALCLVVAGGLTVFLLAGRTRRVRRTVPGSASEGGAQQVALSAYRVFWGSAGLGLLAVFVLAGYGGGGDPLRAHYLVGCFFALVSVLASTTAVWQTRVRASWLPRLLAVAALVAFSVYAANTAARTASLDAAQFNFRLQEPLAADPLPLLEAHGLHRGYAGYWEAYDLDWRSAGRLSVWPLLIGPHACSGGSAPCPYSFAPQGEYAGTGESTFIITPWSRGGCVTPVPAVAVFGSPRAVYTVGPYTISVYGYDVADRFARTTGLFC